MKYTVTCLTPTLVGDGHKLSPIDYMVWKDQVNVLDQTRIFRLLAKGPRLEGYLTQLKRATKLDFASWGGFAQNFAGRRIPFENAAYSAYWNRAPAESLSIPTFAEGRFGPLPARRCDQRRVAHRHALRCDEGQHRYRNSPSVSRRAASAPSGRTVRRSAHRHPHALLRGRRFRASSGQCFQGVS